MERVTGEFRRARYFSMTDRLKESSGAGAIVLSFGWNSAGMGKWSGFEQIELLLVCHGGAHNDTICLAERRQQGTLFA